MITQHSFPGMGADTVIKNLFMGQTAVVRIGGVE